MDVNETIKDAGSELDAVRKSERKPMKKKFEDFEIELRKRTRLENDGGNESSLIEYQSVDKDREISSENQFDIESSQSESIVFTVEERLAEDNMLDKLKTLESAESDNNNHCSEPKRLSVKELLEIVEPKMSISQFQNLVNSKTLNVSSLKKTQNTKRFRNEWLKMSEFKGWLQPHALPDKAFCAICNKVLNAGKSELEKHGATRKHYNQLEQLQSASGEQFQSVSGEHYQSASGEQLESASGGSPDKAKTSSTGSPVLTNPFNAVHFRSKTSSESSNDGMPGIPDSRPPLEIVIPSGWSGISAHVHERYFQF